MTWTGRGWSAIPLSERLLLFRFGGGLSSISLNKLGCRIMFLISKNMWCSSDDFFMIFASITIIRKQRIIWINYCEKSLRTESSAFFDPFKFFVREIFQYRLSAKVYVVENFQSRPFAKVYVYKYFQKIQFFYFFIFW